MLKGCTCGVCEETQEQLQLEFTVAVVPLLLLLLLSFHEIFSISQVCLK